MGERARPVAGWPDGGLVAGRWRVCAGCRDDIWPAEYVYPAVDESAGVLCAVCEVARRRLLAALVDERFGRPPGAAA